MFSFFVVKIGMTVVVFPIFSLPQKLILCTWHWRCGPVPQTNTSHFSSLQDHQDASALTNSTFTMHQM